MKLSPHLQLFTSVTPSPRPRSIVVEGMGVITSDRTSFGGRRVIVSEWSLLEQLGMKERHSRVQVSYYLHRRGSFIWETCGQRLLNFLVRFLRILSKAGNIYLLSLKLHYYRNYMEMKHKLNTALLFKILLGKRPMFPSDTIVPDRESERGTSHIHFPN